MNFVFLGAQLFELVEVAGLDLIFHIVPEIHSAFLGWLIPVITAIVGAVKIYQALNEPPDKFGADEQAIVDELTEDAEEQAALDAAEAAAALDQFMGQLGEDFATYDEWYIEQVNEWNDTDGSLSLEDYIRSQQVSELGEWGVERARLESQVAIAEERLATARRDVAAQFEFAGQQYDAGVTRSQRTTRGEAAAVAAMGIRGGTIQETVAENQRVRMESLDLYMDKMEWVRDVNLMGIDTAAREIAHAQEIGLASLDLELVGARTNYDFAMEHINLDLEQYTDMLQFQHDLNFGWDDWNKQLFGDALGVAGTAFSIFTAGVGAGLWGNNATPAPVGGGGGSTVPSIFTQ